METHFNPEGHYSQQQPGSSQQPQPQSSQQWSAPALHLQVPQGHNQSSFPSPVSPSSSLNEHHYPPYFQQHTSGHEGSQLSLNLSGLSVTSPTNVSPINPPTSSTLSPITPITPPSSQSNPFPHAHLQHHQPQFQFAPPDPPCGRYDEPQPPHQYDYSGVPRRLTSSSRSSSSSDKSVPRKRSFSTTPLATSMEERMYDNGPNGVMDLSTPGSYDDMDIGYPSLEAGSPIDGSTSSGEMDDQLKPLESQLPSSSSSGTSYHGIPPGSITVLGKPSGTNNFVTKLYQMINDSKSTQFIAWTELGTSFVVSNVGEFSRSILGSHFKHNNFSSFVRQLNMYGFHKINRTPRAQRTTTDAQTWEFSHHKFLRGRPDLLEEIKRKALEPDPAVKHRVELPGEVAAQLALMREDGRRTERELYEVKKRCERLAGVVGALWEAVGKAVPGGVAIPFPADLMEPISPGEGPSNSPNIYVTQAAHSQNNFPTPTPSSSFNLPTLHHHSSLSSLHSLSPGSSPTTGEFPSHIHSHTPSLSRQTSYQSLPYDNSHMHGRYDNGLPPSPGSHTQRPLEPFPSDYSDGRPGSAKRQRMAGHHSSMNSPHPHDPHNAIVNGGEAVTRKLARARSDSAPLGYALGATWANQGRPRSGSGLAAGGRVTTANMMRKEDSLVQNIANTGRVGPQGGAIGKQSPAQ